MIALHRYRNPEAMDLILRGPEPVALAPLSPAERAHISAWKRQHQVKHAITPTDFRIPTREEDEPCP